MALEGWYKASYPMRSVKSYRDTHDWVRNDGERSECCVCWCKDGGEYSRWPCGARVPIVNVCSPPKED